MRNGWSRWGFDAAWFLVFAGLSSAWCVGAGRELGPTFDEPFYLEEGLRYWRTGSLEALLAKGTMPLPVVVCTAGPHFYERWRGRPLDLATEFDTALTLARPATLAFWWLLLAYGQVAGRRIGGPWGGRFAVALLACEPVLLAQAALATTDVAIAAALLAFAVHFSDSRNVGWRQRVALCGFLYGVALLAKASALAFGVLIMVALEFARRWGDRPAEEATVAKVRAGLGAVFARSFRKNVVEIVAIGLLVTFIVCGSDWKAEQSFVAWAHTLPDGMFGRSMAWIAEHLTIFNNAGNAIGRQIKHNMQGHGTYLLGVSAPRALWYYFPVALTIKLTVSLLLLFPLLAVLAPASLRNRWLAVAAVLLLFSLNCRVQIGVRLVLPLIVFGIVGVGAALGDALRRAGPGWRRRVLAAAAGLSVAWAAWAAVAVWPNGLCYANELWGGAERAHERISGSDYDWGQGVRELERWSQANERPLAILYYGTDPAARSGRFLVLNAGQAPAPDRAAVRAATGGRELAVSVTLLYGPRSGIRRLDALADYLRDQKPIARTTCFFIYQFE